MPAASPAEADTEAMAMDFGYPVVPKNCSQNELNAAFRGFSKAAEIEIIHKFGWKREESKAYTGRGCEPIFRWESLALRCAEATGGSVAGKAWQWLKVQLKWLNTLGAKASALGAHTPEKATAVPKYKE